MVVAENLAEIASPKEKGLTVLRKRLTRRMKVKVLVTQLCSTLCDPMDYSLLGYSVHGILQARILEWVAIPFSRGSSRPGNGTWVSRFAGKFFTI